MNWETSNQKDTETLTEWARKQQGGDDRDKQRQKMFKKKNRWGGGIKFK